MAINAGDAVIKMGLDKTQFQQGIKECSTQTQDAAKKMQTSMRNAAIAITAIGVAGLALIDKARKMNAELKQVGITAGISEGKMRDLALELSNVTFRLGSVINTLGILSRAGVTNEEDLKAHANAFDAFADAIGLSAEEVAEKLIPAYNMFGDSLPRTADDFDNLTYMVKNSMVSFQDLGPVFDYVAAYGQDLGLSMNDLISIMTILADRGVTGSAVTKLFRTAITEATNEGKSLNEVLGITTQEMDTYIQKMSTDAVGATQTYADAANEQYGLMDKLKAGWEDMTLAVGSLLTPLEPVFGLFSALGPILLTMSMTTLPGLVSNIKDSILWIGKLAISAGRAVIALVAKAAAAIWASLGPLGIIGIAAATAGVIALGVSIKKARDDAASISAMAEGGIVTKPMRALIGEAGPEAVIPLSKGGLPTTNEVHIHVGNYMGDEMSMRQLVRTINQMIKEEDRRNFFGQVQSGYGYGRSSL